MIGLSQKEKAVQFRRMHEGPPMLVLPNAWDAVSARVCEEAGFQAIATSSSAVAAALGYADGEQVSRDEMVEAVGRIARAVQRAVSADMEAGFGRTIEEVLETIKMVIAAGVVGINIEDSRHGEVRGLVDIGYQVELLKAIRELGAALDVPLVINARTDVFLLRASDAVSQFEQAVERLNRYREAGADCLFAIGVSDVQTIAGLVREVHGPLNILAGAGSPSLIELAQMGVARVSFGSGLLRAVLGRLKRVAHDLFERGPYTSMTEEMISGAEMRTLVTGR